RGAAGCRASSPQAAALAVGAVEVPRPGRGHRGRGRELEGERRGRHDLRETVDLARAGAAEQLEPRARVRETRPAADGRHLEPRQAERDVETALDAAARPV